MSSYTVDGRVLSLVFGSLNIQSCSGSMRQCTIQKKIMHGTKISEFSDDNLPSSNTKCKCKMQKIMMRFLSFILPNISYIKKGAKKRLIPLIDINVYRPFPSTQILWWPCTYVQMCKSSIAKLVDEHCLKIQVRKKIQIY